MGSNYKWLDKDMLTPRQLKLFNYLKEYKKENNYMPTYINISQKYTKLIKRI